MRSRQLRTVRLFRAGDDIVLKEFAVGGKSRGVGKGEIDSGTGSGNGNGAV